MRALTYRSAGPAAAVLRMDDIPPPRPAPGEVRVRLQYSCVNPTDVKRRAAEQPDGFQIPHHDGAGIIDVAGEGVDPARVGRRVWTFHAAWQRRWGTAAEYTCIPSNQAVEAPPGMDMRFAATIGVPFLTAAHAVFCDGPVAGQRILVTGGGGAVGNAAIRLARHAGATVVTTAATQQRRRLAEAAGAHVVVDRRRRDAQEALRQAAGSAGYIRAIDVAVGAHLDTLTPLMSRHGTVIGYGSDAPRLDAAVRPLMFGNLTLRFFVVYLLSDSALSSALSRVQRFLEDGAAEVLPTREYTLDEGASAHADVEQGLVGKAVLTISK